MFVKPSFEYHAGRKVKKCSPPSECFRRTKSVFVLFGSFGLSTKEPYTTMLCPLLVSALALVSSVHTFP